MERSTAEEVNASSPAVVEESDSAAVRELITDIEAELRLHQARIQEFLDGTADFAAITSGRERSRLLHLAHLLGETLADMEHLAQG